MFIQVKLIKGFAQPLWYQIPHDWKQTSLIGTVVTVPFRTTHVPALVINSCTEFKKKPSFIIKYASKIQAFPQDPFYHEFITKLSSYYQVEELHFIKRLYQFLHTKENEKETNHMGTQTTPIEAKHINLTDEQQCVYDYLAPHISTPHFTPTLVHGVTGSGKTEVYKKLIAHTIKDKKSVVLLLPEVTLAINFEHILRTGLPPEIPIFSFHCASDTKNKKLLWQALLSNQPALIIGVHLPILLPIPNPGLIIIDEEHEPGFQEKKHPKINSKDAAIWRAQLHNIPILLGSATPTIATLFNVKTKGWKLFQIKKRFAGAFAAVKTVYLTDKKLRRNFWISTELEQAIKNRLEKKEQIIIFLNRRGYSFFVQCKPCGAIFQCPSCSVSLTLHTNDRLSCHYCSYNIAQPKKCSACGAPEESYLKKGIGTQQVVTILQTIFPRARIDRADLDSTLNKKKWQQTMHDFEQQKIDILVGTQTITKGYHFPHVTLVGVLWADINLHFPMYNAAETALQQLIQVAGRAGRVCMHSDVIIQTLTEHAIFDYVNEVDYLKFYQHEIENRTLANYPPYTRLAEIELKNSDETILEQEMHAIAAALRAFNEQHTYGCIILGPAKPPVHKIKNIFSRKIYVKNKQIAPIIHLFAHVQKLPINSALFFTPNPLN